jgi:hypothetical protein
MLLLLVGNQLCALDTVLDEIVAVIYTSEKKIVVTLSDIRPGLDGTLRTLRMIILENLMILDAEKLKVPITDEDIDRFIAHLQKENNLTLDAVRSLFKELGYSMEEGRELLKRKQLVDAILSYRVREAKGLEITREDVIAYDNEHPEYTEATYTLIQAFVPSEKITKEDIERLRDLGTLETAVTWDKPFTLKESDLAADRQFIIHEPVGSLVEFEEVEGGFDLTRLVSKQPAQRIPLDQRYDELMMTLKMQRYDARVKSYHQQLLSEYTIRFTHPEDKKLVYA